MATETKIGLGLMILLVGVFGFVVYKKWDDRQQELAAAGASAGEDGQSSTPENETDFPDGTTTPPVIDGPVADTEIRDIDAGSNAPFSRPGDSTGTNPFGQSPETIASNGQNGSPSGSADALFADSAPAEVNRGGSGMSAASSDPFGDGPTEMGNPNSVAASPSEPVDDFGFAPIESSSPSASNISQTDPGYSGQGEFDSGPFAGDPTSTSEPTTDDFALTPVAEPEMAGPPAQDEPLATDPFSDPGMVAGEAGAAPPSSSDPFANGNDQFADSAAPPTAPAPVEDDFATFEPVNPTAEPAPTDLFAESSPTAAAPPPQTRSLFDGPEPEPTEPYSDTGNEPISDPFSAGPTVAETAAPTAPPVMNSEPAFNDSESELVPEPFYPEPNVAEIGGAGEISPTGADTYDADDFAPVTQRPRDADPSGVTLESPTNGQGNGPKVYVVEKNDSYWTISKRVYGDARLFQALAKFNQPRVRDAKELKPGMMVLIPKISELRSRFPRFVPRAAPDPDDPDNIGGFFIDADGLPAYRVMKGETLTHISQDHLGRASRWVQIYEMNKDRLKDPQKLKVGLVLRLPPDASRVRFVSRPDSRN
ncbi:LysM peptidoglycan-binding domain-containing protein [Stratiformator vulcanicus]|uniref:LysM domain/BON superfamily protein n=1 Tax=Stratiformator vulcanicus TaxID=2527980 RepID=A0A517R2B2_9PLAN|nr:LysM peptidoglycan-binding domain-containing protein [Stratiformator vulcanicus]QDT38025.1 LysM domain/BON superfamily protein [Stratiformator vulcanicus]